MDTTILHTVFAGLTVLLMFVGMIGSIIPRVPGLPLMWSSVVIFSIATKFEVIDLNLLMLMTAMIAIEVLIDFASSLRGTHRFEVNFWGVIGALAGVFVASGFRSISLLIILPLSGVIIGQLISGHDSLYAMETRNYTMIGYVGGTILKVIIGLGIIGLFMARIMTSSVTTSIFVTV